jgi:hypothetical protein
MSIFKLDINADELKRLEGEIEKRMLSRKSTHSNYIQKEDALAASVLDYVNAEVDDLPYELFRAREYVKIFPEDDPFSMQKTSKLGRFYRRVVRRLLRKQIVFNEFMLSASEETWKKLKNLEDRISALEKKKPGTGQDNDNA